MYAGFHHRPLPVDEVLDRVGLTDRADVRNARLSGGQRRRLDVALALIGDPDLVFLDEPTTGFDPEARRAAWDSIDGLRALGKTVVLTTHDLDEAEALADRIAVLVAGRIVAVGTPATIGGRRGRQTEIRVSTGAARPLPSLPARLRRRSRSEDDALVVTTSSPVTDLHALTAWLLEHGVDDASVEVRRPSLEDVYFDLIATDADVAVLSC
jgi:ABC-2 type transport system ATP-binding protein